MAKGRILWLIVGIVLQVAIVVIIVQFVPKEIHISPILSRFEYFCKECCSISLCLWNCIFIIQCGVMIGVMIIVILLYCVPMIVFVWLPLTIHNLMIEIPIQWYVNRLPQQESVSK